jgi:hypothetical protein
MKKQRLSKHMKLHLAQHIECTKVILLQQFQEQVQEAHVKQQP